MPIDRRQLIMKSGGGVPPLDISWSLPTGLDPENRLRVYRPYGAASLAASYVNLANPGTGDATNGTPPTMATLGWLFDGIGQYLKTGLISGSNHTILMFLINHGPTEVRVCVGGRATNNGMLIMPNFSTGLTFINLNATRTQAPALDIGVVGIANTKGYRDGLTAVTGMANNTNTTRETYIGALNEVGTASYFANCTVLAVAMYNAILTDAQFLESSRGMLRMIFGAGIMGTSKYYANCGAILQYEYTQAWSCGVTFRRAKVASKYADIFFSNVTTGAPYPGYEFFILGDKLCVRILNTFGGDKYIEVTGGTNVLDGVEHRAWASYDGSGAAAGVKLYLDGVLETLTVGKDTLDASSIVSAGQNFYLANQQDLANGLFGSMRDFVLDNIVRDQAYITANSSINGVPAADAGVRELLLKFDERTGTTAADGSGNGYNATLSSAAMWS